MAYRKFLPKILPALILGVAFLQYLNTLPHDYAWDDKLVITGNEYTKKGAAGLLDIFTKRVSIPYKSEYRPVPQAMYAVEYELFSASPHASHFFNVLWYALTCLLVYFFVRFVFPKLHPSFPFCVALLFAVHPLHVEVVANIKSRDEILSLFFGLAAVMLSVKALERRRWAWLAAGVFCFALALLSKSSAITLLPIVVLAAWYRSDNVGISRRLLVAAAVIAACCGALVFLIRYLHNTVSDELTLHLNSTVLNNIFLWTTQSKKVLPTALVIIFRYMALFLYPHPLIHLYGYNQIPLSGWRDFGPWAVLAALFTLAWVIRRSWRRKPLLLFGVAFFAVTYSIYSNLFYLAPDTMADRYVFAPSVGLAILFVGGLFKLAAIDLQAPRLVTRRAQAAAVLFALVLCGYAVRTYVGNRDWENDYTLIYNRIQYMDDNAAAQAIYGFMLEKESVAGLPPALELEKKRAAMKAFTRAVEIYPDFFWAWVSIGRLFAEQQMYGKAELAFLKAQRLEPLNPDGYFNLGTLYLAQRAPNLAIPYLEKAVLLDSKMETAYVMLGRAYLQADNIDNLGAMTSTATKWFPDNVELKALSATYYFRRREYARAFPLARSVIAKDPQNVLAQIILSSPAAGSY